MKRKEDIAIWYAEQIMNHWQCPYDEIEWLVNNLKEDEVVKIKLNEVSSLIKELDKRTVIKSDHLVDLLQYHSLLEELRKSNG